MLGRTSRIAEPALDISDQGLFDHFRKWSDELQDALMAKMQAEGESNTMLYVVMQSHVEEVRGKTKKRTSLKDLLRSASIGSDRSGS